MRDIFMDYQSTTPIDPRVLETMLPYFTQAFGNPHSTEHRFGMTAQLAVDQALEDIGRVVGATGHEIVLTSGATESNNLALRGTLPRRGKSHLISCVTEHSSVLSTLSSLHDSSCSTTLLPVGDDGLIDLELLAASITPYLSSTAPRSSATCRFLHSITLGSRIRLTARVSETARRRRHFGGFCGKRSLVIAARCWRRSTRK
ncbi:TPA: aminotransferase class V-fold PLP-dependent enzyme [Stenotrophomonas maltophilia]|nr:aminotransferase class V-fold PLP-dependent enzyme [Stenotrophomonas maltophilia]